MKYMIFFILFFSNITFANNLEIIKEYEKTGIIPSYIEEYEAWKIIQDSKVYNDNKPFFNLLFEFNGKRYIAKENNVYEIIDNSLKKITNNQNSTKNDDIFKVDTNIIYSAIFDDEKQIIYILKIIVAEVYEKNNTIITIDLKNGKIYNFYDDLAMFPIFYLYNGKLFATGVDYNNNEIDTYIINGNKAEKYKNDLKFKNKDQYSLELLDNKNNIIFLDNKPNNVKLISTKTNNIYEMKCGLMYTSYYWVKTLSNALNGCNDNDPFGEFGLDWEAFTYTEKEQSKIYSGCNTDDKNILTIEEFCQTIDE